jgi:hypothetical protein
MMGAQTLLASAVAPFLQALDASQVDYRVGVTTGNTGLTGARGRLVGSGASPVRVVTASTSMAAQVLAANLTVGTSGPSQQSGLTAAFHALTDPVRNASENAGFLRNDADLEVIHVSASDDRSVLPGSFFESHILDLEDAGGRRVTVDALVASASACMSASVVAQPAPRLVGVAAATGGRVHSICDADFGAAMAAFTESILGRKRSFRLSTLPLPVTLMVTVDGAAVPPTTSVGATNWAYSSATNAVVFEGGAIPAIGAAVSVSYSVDCVP